MWRIVKLKPPLHCRYDLINLIIIINLSATYYVFWQLVWLPVKTLTGSAFSSVTSYLFSVRYDVYEQHHVTLLVNIGSERPIKQHYYCASRLVILTVKETKYCT